MPTRLLATIYGDVRSNTYEIVCDAGQERKIRVEAATVHLVRLSFMEHMSRAGFGGCEVIVELPAIPWRREKQVWVIPMEGEEGE